MLSRIKKVSSLITVSILVSWCISQGQTNTLLTPLPNPSTLQGYFRIKDMSRTNSPNALYASPGGNYVTHVYSGVTELNRLEWMLIPCAKNDLLSASYLQSHALFYIVNRHTGLAMAPQVGNLANCYDNTTNRCVRQYEINAAVSPDTVEWCEWMFLYHGYRIYGIYSYKSTKYVQIRDCNYNGSYLALWQANGTCERWGAQRWSGMTGVPVSYNSGAQVPVAPEMSSFDDFYTLPEETAPVVVGVVVMPFIEVYDPALTPAQKVDQSPFYQLERSYVWVREAQAMVDSGVAHDFTVNVTEGASSSSHKAITNSTGWRITSSIGFSLDGMLSGGLEKEVTSNLEVESSTDTSRYTEKTIEQSYHMTGETKYAYAMWTLVNRYKLKRMNGQAVSSWDVYSQTHTFDLCTGGTAVGDGRPGPPKPRIAASKQYRSAPYYDITGRPTTNAAIRSQGPVGIYIYRDGHSFRKRLFLGF